jgi:hypothetical protein
MIRRILFHDASRSHQNRIKKNIREKLFLIEKDILHQRGLKFCRVEKETNQNTFEEEIENFKCDVILNHIGDTIPKRNVIYVKDKNNISDRLT